MSVKNNPNSYSTGLALAIAGCMIMSCTATHAGAKPTQGSAMSAPTKASHSLPAQVAQAKGPDGTGAPSVTTDLAAEAAAAAQPKVPSKDEASRLASQLVALKQMSWGKVSAVSESGNQYYVTFDTPDRERMLIGQRTVIVDKTSGVASIMKRR